MQALTPELKRLRDQLRKLDRSLFTFYEDKEANIGGGQDMPFEQAFSNLAHAYLKDKAPGLQDYEVGFQLIDRNPENTKAIGVTGFKVGSQWLYAPVFFLNGDMKGHEMLYIKNQDLFVPMKENWLNYLLNRKPDVLGEGVDRNLSNIGVLPPNLYQISRSPAKYASDNVTLPGMKVASWAKPVLPDLAYFAVTSPLHDEKYRDLKTIVDLVKDAGSQGVRALADHCFKYPVIIDKLNERYGPDTLDNAVKAAATNDLNIENAKRKKLKSAPKVKTPNEVIDLKPIDKIAKAKRSGSIVIVSYEKVMQEPLLGTMLDDKEKETLVKGDVVIKDKRDPEDVTIAYKIQTPQRLETPTQSGLYDVLVKPGDFKKCLVIIGPYKADKRQQHCLVVDVDNKNWLATHPSKVWIKNDYSRDEYQKWFKDLPDGDLNEGYSGKVLIGATGQGTMPFRVSKEHGGEVEAYDVYFIGSSKKERSVNYPVHDAEDTLQQRPTFPSRLVCTGHVGKSLRAMGSELLVPDGYKVLSLEQPECGCGYDSSPPAVLDLGAASDLELDIVKSGHLTRMNISHSGSHVNIDNREFGVKDALIELVVEKGLREKQAREILDNAKDQKTYQVFLKFAEPSYELQRSGPTAPYQPEPTIGADPITGGRVPTQPSLEANLPVTDMAARNYDRSVYDPRPDATSQPNMVGGSPGPDQKAMDTAMQAAESGQKEVFDTAMLGSLLKSVRDDSMVDKYMGDLIKGMDRLARILFMLYWHMEEFEDRYGKQDLPELEDGLRNAFEAMGDIVLFLKQKTIEPYPDEMSDVDLGAVADE